MSTNGFERRGMKTSLYRGSAVAILALALSMAGAAVSGEVEVPPPPPPPVTPPVAIDPNGVPPDKPVTTSALEVDFVYDDNGRRDPFTFTKNVAVMKENPDGPLVDQGPNTPEDVPPEVLKRAKSQSELACSMAEAALMELDPNAAITKCDQGMEEFKPIPDLTKYPDLEIVKGRLLRARKAADQMRARQTAQRDFDALNIEISGVMALKKNSQAIINGEIAHKGTMVKSSNDAADVMVDEILPERVMFMFRGYKMMLLLSEAGRKK